MNARTADTITTVSSAEAQPVEVMPAPAPVSTPSPRVEKPHAGASGTILPRDSVATDSVAADTLKTKTFGIVLEAPEHPVPVSRTDNSSGMSYIIGGLSIIFFIIGLRFRNNRKILGSMLHNMVDVRMRGNAFDETVRETSFVLLLNILWGCCAGIVLWGTLSLGQPGQIPLPALTLRPAASIAVCMGAGVAYTFLMALAYLTVGTVFSDSVHARMWLKGFTSGIGILSIIWFPLALLILFYPEWRENLLWTTLGLFLLVKIVFIWKGFRIFFTQISSWVLFLYYLCSLEIVPLILTYLAALQLCLLL